MMAETIELPASKLVYDQKKIFGPVYFTEGKDRFRIKATVRYDDQCRNGHNSFAITAEIDEKRGNGWREYSGGCCHEEVAEHFPQLAPLIKWHLTSSDGPLHYIANTVYHAGNRDHNGLLKGEFRQHTSHEGVPNWELAFPVGQERHVYATAKPAPVTLEWKPYGRTGEGKERDLEAARHCAVWPDATDEDLTAPGLKERLLARLPGLMVEFKAAVESLGFVY